MRPGNHAVTALTINSRNVFCVGDPSVGWLMKTGSLMRNQIRPQSNNVVAREGAVCFAHFGTPDMTDLCQRFRTGRRMLNV